MNNKKIFFLNLVLLILIISFDTLAKVNSFYYFYPNTDIIMHLLGGFSITGLGISILKEMKLLNTLNIFILILLISIFWEYVEFYAGKNVLINKNFWIDTSVDLLMNALGGIIAYICFYKITPKIKNLQK